MSSWIGRLHVPGRVAVQSSLMDILAICHKLELLSTQGSSTLATALCQRSSVRGSSCDDDHVDCVSILVICSELSQYYTASQ